MARGSGLASLHPAITDTPFKGRGVRSLAGKGTSAPKRKSNLRAADAHVSSVRAAANRNVKKGPMLHGGGMLHEMGGPHPIKHLENDGESKGQSSHMADFRAAAVAK